MSKLDVPAENLIIWVVDKNEAVSAHNVLHLAAAAEEYALKICI